jgi:hypothetical protein
VVARDRGGRVDDQVEAAEIALGARERLGHHLVVPRVAAHDGDARMRLAQGLQGRVGARDGQRPPAGRQAVGDDRPPDVARPEDDEDGWSGHAGSLPAVTGPGAE